MPYPKPGDPYAPPGWKPPVKPPKVPPIGKGIGDIGSWLKGASSKVGSATKFTGLGLGKVPFSGSSLGTIAPWLGRLGTAGAVLAGSTAVYNLAKDPMIDLMGFRDYQNYLDRGGNLNYNQWTAAGSPGKGVKVRTAADVAAKPLVAPGQVAGEETDEERYTRLMMEAEQEAGQREAQAWATPIPGGAKEGEQVTIGGEIGFWTRDERGYPQFNSISNVPKGVESREPTEQDLWERGFAEQKAQAERDFQEREFQARKEEQEAQRAWWREQATMEAEQEKQRQLASLRTNPASWLEYGLLAGQTPGIQPWMKPLMPQQYAGFGAGQAIPGYNPTGQGLGLPELTPPSRQYQARMGPTAQQQYYGYEQARTGARPEETQFRLWSQSAPGGRSSNLSWMR